MEVLYRLLRTAEPWFGRRVYDDARRALNLTVRPMEELVFVSHCRPSLSISIQDFFALYPISKTANDAACKHFSKLCRGTALPSRPTLYEIEMLGLARRRNNHINKYLSNTNACT